SPFAWSATGSRSTEINRCLPPYGNGSAAPCTVASCVRMKLLPESKSCCSDIVSLVNPICSTGTVDAEYTTTSGGWMPGGSCLSPAWTIAVVCASADWMLAVGWKYTLMTEMPGSDCDSMCSTSFT